MIRPELQKIFANFLVPDTEVFRAAKKALVKRLPECLPFLPQIINDRRYWKQYEGYFGWPICELLDALAEPAPVELVPVIGKFVKS
jgi:hypothetical protein